MGADWQGNYKMLNTALYNASYNICKIAKSASPEHFWICSKDRSVFADLLSVVRDIRDHEHIFSSILQVRTWYHLHKGERNDMVKPMKDEDVVM